MSEIDMNNIMEFVGALIRDNLDIGEIPIITAHRIGKMSGTEERPRSIIIRFPNESMKQKVLQAAWAKKEVKIGDRRIFFEDDFTDEVYKERGKYKELRKKLFEKEIKSRIVYPAKLKVFEKDGTFKMFDNPQAAAEGVRREYGVSVKMPKGKPDLESTLKAAGWKTAGPPGPGKRRTQDNEHELMTSVKALLDSLNRHEKDKVSLDHHEESDG